MFVAGKVLAVMLAEGFVRRGAPPRERGAETRHKRSPFPEEVENRMAHIVVDEDRCKGCEICVSVCPKKVIAMADHFNRQGYRPATMVKTRAKVPALVGGGMPEDRVREGISESGNECNGCTLCARMCPDVAITVHR